jgi:L-alanine-DL-glutamate epimerase-like enolase superfamily enzyme
MAPRLRLRSIDWFERPVVFRMPFRFGAVTVTSASQLFLFAEIETEDGRRSLGATAELMVPKWFNKDPALTPDQTVAQLRRALVIARDAYLQRQALDTAFGHHAACHAAVLQACAREGIPGLAAAFGPAEIDKAILDALLRAYRVDVFGGLGANIAGLDARLTPDIDDAAIAGYLQSRKPLSRIMVRHTVGMTDPVEQLPDIHRLTGCRYFKLKLSGDVTADMDRLDLIARTLDAEDLDYRVTLDANEQYGSHDALMALGDGMLRQPQFGNFLQRLLYVEQPLPRDLTFAHPLGAFGKSFAVIVDEAESDYDTFPKATALGYRGVSSKACKGIYKSLINGARAARWSGSGDALTFLAGEDLTCQAGLAVQQDLALLAFHGIAHSERNGHHFVGGFPATPAEEVQAFRGAHPDLYDDRDGQARLAICGGALSIGSLSQPGFASGVDPGMIRRSVTDFHGLTPE